MRNHKTKLYLFSALIDFKPALKILKKTEIAKPYFIYFCRELFMTQMILFSIMSFT